MKIKYIELEHSNPSLGPHETVRQITLFNKSETAAEIEKFLSNTKLFGKVNLRTYLEAALANNSAVLRVIKEAEGNVDTSDSPSGGTVSRLLFVFENSEPVNLNHLYYQSLDGYAQQFFPYMVKNGTISDSPSDVEDDSTTE